MQFLNYFFFKFNFKFELYKITRFKSSKIIKFQNYEESEIYYYNSIIWRGSLKEYIKNIIKEENARTIFKLLLNNKLNSYLHYECEICNRDIKAEDIIY